MTGHRMYALALGLLLAVGALAIAIHAAGGAARARAEGGAEPAPLLLAAPTPAPAVEAARALPRAVVAYAAPCGAVLGALEPGWGYAVVGAYGAGWLLIDAPQAGRVWVRAIELVEGARAPSYGEGAVCGQ